MKLGDAWGSGSGQTYNIDASVINYYLDYFNSWIGAPDGLLLSIAQAESGYDPGSGSFDNGCNAYSACGLMQLKPIALQDIAQRWGMQLDPLNPIQAIVGAALYLYLNRAYLRYYSRSLPPWAAVVVAYNGGWRAGLSFMQTGQPPTQETYNYLAFIGSRVRLA